MESFFFRMRLFLCLSVVSLGLLSCNDSSRSQSVGWHSTAPEGTMPPGFDTFIQRWNKKTQTWLENEVSTKQEEVNALRKKYFSSQDQKERDSLQSKLVNDSERLEILKTRLAEGDYIQLKTKEEIPTNLTWQDGMDEPEIGDPRAKKGGTVRLWVPGSFPDTFRPVGPNSNSGFRAKLYDEISMGLLNMHPVTGKLIPCLADRWSEAPDQRTVFFHIDPDATYSDGTKVRAIDFLVDMYIRTSEYTKAVMYENVFKEEVSHITLYGDDVIAVTLPEPKPLLPYYCSVINCSPPHFYSEFGPNYVTKYQWRVPPTTGAYTVDPDSMIRGRQVTMDRVQNWWAKDKKYSRYLFNPDHIVYNFIADESKAIELFRIGELDIMLLNKPELWHERMEIPEVHNGFIRRATFFTIYPRPPFGIFLNTSRPPFDNKDVRLGFHHALNIQKIININFRGDYQRLGSYASGYGKFTDDSIRAREFSPEKAREYFAKAGYTITCPDGILRKADGTRLTAEITFSNSSTSLATVMSQLREDARKCGLDLQLDSLDSMVNFRKIMEKRHQGCFMAWGFTPPHPNLA
jgi:microcin C transport system substrate-binding protein